jgi:CheY-like chemotaxis protein
MGANVPEHILVLNDSQEILELLREILEGEGGYKVTVSGYKEESVDEIKELKPDLIISDYKFGDEAAGMELLQKLQLDRETSRIPVIICSAALKELKEMEGHLKAKGIDILYKPFDIDELLRLVSHKFGK